MTWHGVRPHRVHLTVGIPDVFSLHCLAHSSAGVTLLLKASWRLVTRRLDAFHAQRRAAGAAVVPYRRHDRPLQPGAGHAMLREVAGLRAMLAAAAKQSGGAPHVSSEALELQEGGDPKRRGGSQLRGHGRRATASKAAARQHAAVAAASAAAARVSRSLLRDSEHRRGSGHGRRGGLSKRHTSSAAGGDLGHQSNMQNRHEQHGQRQQQHGRHSSPSPAAAVRRGQQARAQGAAAGRAHVRWHTGGSVGDAGGALVQAGARKWRQASARQGAAAAHGHGSGKAGFAGGGKARLAGGKGAAHGNRAGALGWLPLSFESSDAAGAWHCLSAALKRHVHGGTVCAAVHQCWQPGCRQYVQSQTSVCTIADADPSIMQRRKRKALQPLQSVSSLNGLGAASQLPPDRHWNLCNTRRWIHSKSGLCVSFWFLCFFWISTNVLITLMCTSSLYRRLAGAQQAAAAPATPMLKAAATAAAAGTTAAQSSRLAQHSGRLAPQHRLLVLFHHFEHPGICEADEEIQLVRSNLLFFLRCVIMLALSASLAPQRGSTIQHRA